MVRITPEGINILVENVGESTELYLQLLDEMLDMLQSEDECKRKERYYFIDLIRAMMPHNIEDLQHLCSTLPKK